jgi:hypothetical protein
MGEGFPFTYSALSRPSFVVRFASVQGSFFLHTTHAHIIYIYIHTHTTVLPMNHSCPLNVICFSFFKKITFSVIICWFKPYINCSTVNPTFWLFKYLHVWSCFLLVRFKSRMRWYAQFCLCICLHKTNLSSERKIIVTGLN